jgi:sugar-phosphatase
MRIAYDAVLLDLFGTLVDDAGRAIEGATAVLESIAGVRWAIVTSCPRPLARYLVNSAGLAIPPEMIVADDVESGKPAPECYLLAARRLAVRPDRCLVVEDSGPGIAAGRAAGMDVLAVLRGKDAGFARAASFTVDAIRSLRLEAQAPGVALVLDSDGAR